MFFSLLSACSNLGPAIAVCEAVPGLHVDANTLEQLRPVLVGSELRALEASEATLGSEAVDREALQVATRCEGEIEDGQVALTRTAPAVADDGSLGDLITTHFTWSLEDGRVSTGLVAALEQRDAIPEDPIEAEAAWEALVASYPDPTLVVDLAFARKEAAKARYWRDHVTLEPEFDSERGRVLVHLKNAGDRSIVDAEFVAEFKERPPHTFVRPSIAADTAKTMVEATPGATELVGVQVTSWELAPLSP